MCLLRLMHIANVASFSDTVRSREQFNLWLSAHCQSGAVILLTQTTVFFSDWHVAMLFWPAGGYKGMK
jgi:hypothetical protein